MSAPSPFAAMRRLHERGARSRGITVDREGVALGPETILLRRTEAGYDCASADIVMRVARTVFGTDAQLDKLPRLLGAIVRALDAGDLVKAQLLGLEMPIGDLDDAQLAKLAAEAELIKAGFDPSQPRDERGRWSGDGDGSSTSEETPVQIADAGEGMSDTGGILPAAANGQGKAPQPTPAPPATILPPAQRSGNVGEYTAAEAAKLPPPPAGSKYVTLADGSVLWSGYMNGGQGGPMLMPKQVSFEDNVKMGKSLSGLPRLAVDAVIAPRESAMAYLFLPGHGPMDYQSVYGSNGNYNRNYVDFTNYNYGVVAAAAGYTRDEALANAGMMNQAKDWWDRHVHGALPKDTSGPFRNKVQNADMIIKGYDDYGTGKIPSLKK